MKEIYINADDYNSDSIRTIQGNNNAEEYKIYLQYDNEKIDLTGKTVNLGFLRVGSTEGDIIENLNVTNPKEGEITLKITNKISKRNGTYSCQLAILGEGDFLEHTATFTLTVENNIFSDITKAIADSKDFTYLENILDKASKLSEKLKENTSSATNANSNLESNITEANNINSKLLENTSTATGLNSNLESNIDLAKEVKETIKDLDAKNTEATEKIEILTGLNAKATELSNNIQQGLPLNSELVKNVESAKIANNELIATNNDAKAKKKDLDNSLEEAKKYISGLDGSKNPVQMQLDIDMLKNGLKSNQALAYKGSSISANETLEGRTEGMRIGGRTLRNLFSGKAKDIYTPSNVRQEENGYITLLQRQYGDCIHTDTSLYKPNTKYTLIIDVKENTLDVECFLVKNDKRTVCVVDNSQPIKARETGITKHTFTTINDFSQTVGNNKWGFYLQYNQVEKEHKGNITLRFILLEGDWTNKEIPQYFEGMKSFGEAELEGDKYKISILSNGKNLLKTPTTDITKKQGNIDITLTKSGEFIVNGSNSTTGGGRHLFMNDYNYKVKKGKSYTLSYERVGGTSDDPNSPILLFSNIDNFDEIPVSTNTSSNKKSVTFEANKDMTLFCGVNVAIGKSYNNYKIKILLEEGNNATQYETYKENKKDVLIKEPLHEGNYLYEDNGQVKVCRNNFEVKLATLNFIKSNVASGTDINTIRFSAQLPNSLDSKGGKGIISNFPILSESTWDKDKENMQISGGNLYIRINKSKLTTQDVEGFKAWLKENPTTVVYQLATPVTEIVENCVDIDLDTFREKTYFNILNSLPGTLDFKVPSNLGSVVQNMAKEVNNIWDVINNLLVPGILKANGNLAMIKLNNNLK